jgi:parallel beta-helix repeat protein
LVRSAVLRVPQDYPTIQAAVDAAKPGDTIEVSNGTYYEHVLVHQKVTIIGENKTNTIVDGMGNGTVFSIQTSGVSILQLTIRNGGSRSNGINIHGYLGTVIRDNIILNNVIGVDVSQSDDTVIQGNILFNNSMYGVNLSWSSGVTVENNTISESAYGVELYGSPNNVLVNNHISGTSYGIYLSHADNNNLTANTLVDNSWNIYATYSSGNLFSKNEVSGGAVGIELYGSTTSSVVNNTATDNSYGIYLAHSGSNTVSGNNASLNDWGIELYNSTGNTVIENNIMRNSWGAYIVEDSVGNSIYHNNFIDNVKQVYQDPSSGNNTWRTPATPYHGNYWSDYPGEDTDGDGVGDTYLPWQGVDYYPLMAEWGGIHDVAVLNVTPSDTSVFPGQLVYINVTVANEGTWKETFNVTVKYNLTEIDVQTVNNLKAGANLTLTFTWNTTGVAAGNYTISGEAMVVVFETDTADNVFVDGVVEVRVVHDVAVIDVTVRPTTVTQGQIVYINVTVQNQGSFTESFNVKVYADENKTVVGDEITIGAQFVDSLQPGANVILGFEWNTTAAEGSYWISAEADVVPGETDTVDNLLLNGKVRVRVKVVWTGGGGTEFLFEEL